MLRNTLHKTVETTMQTLNFSYLVFTKGMFIQLRVVNEELGKQSKNI